MIRGTPPQVQAVAAIVDAGSRLPNAQRPCVECGSYGVKVESYHTETVRCTTCHRVDYYGDRASTYQVKKVRDNGDGTADYGSDPELEDKIKKAKVKPPVKTEEDEILSAVEIVE